MIVFKIERLTNGLKLSHTGYTRNTDLYDSFTIFFKAKDFSEIDHSPFQLLICSSIWCIFSFLLNPKTIIRRF